MINWMFYQSTHEIRKRILSMLFASVHPIVLQNLIFSQIKKQPHPQTSVVLNDSEILVQKKLNNVCAYDG